MKEVKRLEISEAEFKRLVNIEEKVRNIELTEKAIADMKKEIKEMTEGERMKIKSWKEDIEKYAEDLTNLVNKTETNRELTDFFGTKA